MERKMTNIASNDMDGLPFLDALKKAAEKKWCGILRVMKECEQIGTVFMRDGNIAWAVSKNQTENFGSFLERIGMIPKEQHTDIAERYRALGKSKKLGALLEEAGLITRSKLRECLKAHIQAAIASMLGDAQIIVNARHGEMNVDSNLLFLLREVIPDCCNGNGFDNAFSYDSSKKINLDFPEETSTNNDILTNLAALPGYQYSFISGFSGKLLAFHKSDDLSFDFKEAVTSAVSWIISSMTNATDLHMKKIDFILIEYEKDSLFVQWPNGNNDLYIAASFNKNGKPGVIKHKISELIPAACRFTAESICRLES
jgi:hypothetical protein